MAHEDEPSGVLHDGWTALPEAPVGTPAGLLVEVSDGLHDLLVELTPAEWHAAALVGWTVRDVVAHLAAVHEALLLRIHGHDPSPVTLEGLHLANERVIDELRAAHVDATRVRWHDSVVGLRHGIATSDSLVPWLGLEIPPVKVAVDRSFETWIHANDIRRAVGRPEEDPSDPHLRVLCDLAVELLPLGLLLTERPHDALVRLELTGPGGGTWTMPLGTGAASGLDVHLRMPARELCLLMGDRLDHTALQYEVQGDPRAAAVVRDLTLAAPVFARA